ncbi:MAG: hypothetical protein NVSMB33_14430 [Ktedonobacteraceae bacterium]
MPPTQTSCPPNGTARPAVMRTLARGSDATIIYTSGSFGSTLSRYDVATHQKSTLLSVNYSGFGEAQISKDGQWILFVTNIVANSQGFGDEIQMIRADGKGLQTLYCFGTGNSGLRIANMQWSIDDRNVIFSEGTEGQSGGTPHYTLELMDIAKGTVQQELINPASTAGFFASTWLDQTHVYLLNRDINSASQALFLLDTTRGANQSFDELKEVLSLPMPGTGWSFDTSIDSAKIYTAEYQNPTGVGVAGIYDQKASFSGPSTVRVQPATGGQSNTIYTAQSFAITNVRIVTSSLLAFVVDNQNAAGGTSENGLWKMNTDGTGPTRVRTSLYTYLNRNTQYTWSNFSRDSSMYAAQFDDGQQHGLIFGSLNGAESTTFEAQANDLVPGTYFSIVGWTTL